MNISFRLYVAAMLSIGALWSGSNTAAAPVIENFDGWSTSTANGDYTYDHNGVGRWSITNGRMWQGKQRSGTTCANFDDDAPAATLTYRGLDGNGKDGGIGTVSFWYAHWDDDGKSVKFKVQYSTSGGASWVDIGAEVDVIDDMNYREFSAAVNLSGDNILLRVLATAYEERLLIDDFSITDFSGGPIAPSPYVGIDTPSENAVYSNAVSVVTFSGTASNMVGMMTWSNEAAAVGGIFSASSNWSIPEVSLVEGYNTVDVTCTNAVGFSAVDSVTVYREPAAPADSGSSNSVLRIMAANTSSGNYQEYETAGMNIFKGLQPDIVAIQEFDYAYGSIRDMVDEAFGEEFDYFRESGYDLPNGIISRYPIMSSGSWNDSNMSNRGFAWAQIDVPGTNDLYMVSVHFKAGSSDAARRAAEAAELKNLIQSAFSSHAWIVLAGDFNISSESENAVGILESFLMDSPVPADRNGTVGTNAGRSSRYDRVYFSSNMLPAQVAVELPSHSFTNGLVFDSRVYTPLSDVTPVTAGDSGVSGMQHMAVVRDFQLQLAVDEPEPATLSAFSVSSGGLSFSVTGSTGISYVVSATTNLESGLWIPLQTNPAPFSFQESQLMHAQEFYKAEAFEN